LRCLAPVDEGDAADALPGGGVGDVREVADVEVFAADQVIGCAVGVMTGHRRPPGGRGSYFGRGDLDRTGRRGLWGTGRPCDTDRSAAGPPRPVLSLAADERSWIVAAPDGPEGPGRVAQDLARSCRGGARDG